MKRETFTAGSQRRVAMFIRRHFAINGIHSLLPTLFIFSILIAASTVALVGQDTLPEPGPARSVNIPAIKETKLKSGLTVAVVEKKGVPLVTVQLMIKTGASAEGVDKAGLANLTAALITKGTSTRTANQIAEQVEFLGGSINSGAGWNNSTASISVTADKIQQAIDILADVVRNPVFKQEEIDLLKSQTLDELKYNLSQPGFLGNYVASVYSFKEHPAEGTPASIAAINRNDIVSFHKERFSPDNAVLIFAGDVTAERANALATAAFGSWTRGESGTVRGKGRSTETSSGNAASAPESVFRRFLVVDLPDSGQAAVNYTNATSQGRTGARNGVNPSYYSASVLNSLLGGGYSSRLNQEIRIKRGLSYGAGSNFGWRPAGSVFTARTQTKNESAAEVAELVLAEIRKLVDVAISDTELNPRKSVLTGGFGRALETNAGLAAALADLYSFGIPAGELNGYSAKVTDVSEKQIRDFSRANLLGGDMIIVGDYSVFKDDLAKRFPNVRLEVIKADEIDLESPTLQKSSIP
jgi:zinc protease